MDKRSEGTGLVLDEVQARRETIGGMFEDVAKRRSEIVSEMCWTGEISRLSLASLLDMLSILAFDRNATQRSTLNEFYGGDDERARATEKVVMERLYREYDCDNNDINSAIGRGCSLKDGYLRADEVWQRDVRAKLA